MSQIIAGIYEIEEQIGAGGGGIVYLGRHLRLEKKIVLKADKRKLDIGAEALRREVDLLKELSHTYIPQVYDFIQEDGVVYTVMDFIEGESLDKIMARGNRPTQSEVIGWACQLLEALIYLHSRPPYGILHGDIKPANIMLRLNGDICLIDFNIALALGEEGAVKVGFSRGYASPEHYGAEYCKKAVKCGTDETEADNTKTGTKTEVDTKPDRSKMRQNTILLDVRSDIYSLGATLYHLLSGRRPAQNAWEVEPLGADCCSMAVSRIIRKAMMPEPSMRYQSAEEMLNDFLKLHSQDERTKKHRRRAGCIAALCAGMFAAGSVSVFLGLRQMEQKQRALALSQYSENALSEGDVVKAVDMAMLAIPKKNSILEGVVTPQAKKALTDALGVYDLSDGFKLLGTIELPSAPFKIVLSQSGSYMAVVYAYETAVFDLESRSRIAVLKMEHSALADAAFANEHQIIYAGADGVAAYDLQTKRTLWTGSKATKLAVSGDGLKVAAIDRDEGYAAIYRTGDGERIGRCDFGNRRIYAAANDIFADPDNMVFELNDDGTLLAVSFENGGLALFGTEDDECGTEIYEKSDFSDFSGGFSGTYFAFTAGGNEDFQFGLLDIKTMDIIGTYRFEEPVRVQANRQRICLADRNLLVEFDPETEKEKELAYTDRETIAGFSVGIEYTLIATDQNSYSFYDSMAKCVMTKQCGERYDFAVMSDQYAVLGSRNSPYLQLLKQEKHREADLFSYDAGYPHDEARVSLDGNTAMLFGIEGFRIYDRSGKMIAEAVLPDTEQIYDQQFRKSGEESWLEVIWYDGMMRCYSARDGTLLSEEKKKPPDRNLDETFHTENYRIVSSLHKAPEVYDIRSGQLVTTLEEESYLTYVTQLDEYILTEYVSAEGERYGLLLDDNLQTLAYLPGLCDVAEGTFIFDYGLGNLRQCRIYSFEELTALGTVFLTENERRNS